MRSFSGPDGLVDFRKWVLAPDYDLVASVLSPVKNKRAKAAAAVRQSDTTPAANPAGETAGMKSAQHSIPADTSITARLNSRLQYTVEGLGLGFRAFQLKISEGLGIPGSHHICRGRLLMSPL